VKVSWGFPYTAHFRLPAFLPRTQIRYDLPDRRHTKTNAREVRYCAIVLQRVVHMRCNSGLLAIIIIDFLKYGTMIVCYDS